MLKPMDIHNKEFKKAMRGYDIDEVDEFLDEIIVDYTKLQKELDVLKNQVSSYNESMHGCHEKELLLKNALVSAQKFADELKRDAEKQAEAILAQAEERAQRIIGETEARYQKVLSDYTLLASRYQDAKETLKEYFQGQIAMLEQEETGVSTEQVMSYLKQEEQKNDNSALTENEETKINTKLKEILDSTM